MNVNVDLPGICEFRTTCFFNCVPIASLIYENRGHRGPIRFEENRVKFQGRELEIWNCASENSFLRVCVCVCVCKDGERSDVMVTGHASEAAFICLSFSSLVYTRGKNERFDKIRFDAGGLARGEQETPSWRREGWYRHYSREKTIGGAETPSGRAEKADGRTSEVRRSES